MENTSVVSETTTHRITVFTFTLVFYSLVLFVNVAVIAVVVLDPSLHEPMYIFLCVVCLNEIYGTTGFYPKFLSRLHDPQAPLPAGAALLARPQLHLLGQRRTHLVAEVVRLRDSKESSASTLLPAPSSSPCPCLFTCVTCFSSPGPTHTLLRLV